MAQARDRGRERRGSGAGLPRRAALFASVALPPLFVAAGAQAADLLAAVPVDIAALSVGVGLTLAAATSSFLYLRLRRSAAKEEEALAGQVAELRDRLDRAHFLLRTDPFVVIAWGGPSGHTEVTGDATLLGCEIAAAMRFASWLPAEDAEALERAAAALRADGTAFRMTLRPMNGKVLEGDGRPVLGRAVLRIREITGERLEAFRLRDEIATATRERDAMRETLDALPHPIWQRDADGRLDFANLAYAAAVEAKDGADAVARMAEFLDSGVRQEAFRRRALTGAWKARTPAIFAGERRMVDAAEKACTHGSAGYAVDVSELDAVRSDLQRQMESQLRTLDQLPTAVAMFDDAQRLVFCNAAYRSLFQLDQAFIDAGPTDPEILDRLRAERRLPEQADYRAWKTHLLEAYRAIDTQETAGRCAW